jgi:hypothetical protein
LFTAKPRAVQVYSDHAVGSPSLLVDSPGTDQDDVLGDVSEVRSEPAFWDPVVKELERLD